MLLTFPTYNTIKTELKYLILDAILPHIYINFKNVIELNFAMV